MEGLRHFCFMMEGRSFSILLDHKPLALSHCLDPWTAKQCRHPLDMQHLAGADKIAHVLSRPPQQQTLAVVASATAPGSQVPVTLRDIAACQRVSRGSGNVHKLERSDT
jgi:hypothetical protein